MPHFGWLMAAKLPNFVATCTLGLLLSSTVGVSSAQQPSPNIGQLQEVVRSVSNRFQSPEEASFDPGWWTPYVAQPIELDLASRPLTLEQTIVETLIHSKQIKVFSELPLIRETAVIEASAAFDWAHYADTRWDDLSEPIGNSLTAGPGVNRFNDHQWTGRTGIRQRTLTGGTLDLSQQLGFQDNNSQFFVPNPQGTARLVLGFTQPLMRGRGRCYNNSLVVLAQIDQAAASDEFRRQTELHLLEVTRAYWALYLERAALYQRVQLYTRGKEILDRLSARASLDASEFQVATATAAVASRESDLLRAKATVANAQSRLRSLVNSPTLIDVEVLPVDQPTFAVSNANLEESVNIAMQFRPEVLQALKQVKAASIRLDMSKNELLPLLNLTTQTYLAGLAADGQSFDAFGNQFSTGSPSYGVGLVYERPNGNRAALARKQRRQLELRQLHNQFATTQETIRYEVAVAVRELDTSLNELSTKYVALVAQAQQLAAMQARWEQLPAQQVNATLALENLLETQHRVATAEFEYLTAQLTYNLSLVNLKRASGILMRSENIELSNFYECGVPTNVLNKY